MHWYPTEGAGTGQGYVTARRVTVSFEMNPIVLKCEIEGDGVFPNVNSLRLLSEPDPKFDLRGTLLAGFEESSVAK
jgi:hypothetical protein